MLFSATSICAENNSRNNTLPFSFPSRSFFFYLCSRSMLSRFQSTYAMELGWRTTPLTWWLVPTSGVTASFTARPPRRQEVVNSRWRAISLPVRGPLIAIQSRGRWTSHRTVSNVNFRCDTPHATVSLYMRLFTSSYFFFLQSLILRFRVHAR